MRNCLSEAPAVVAPLIGVAASGSAVAPAPIGGRANFALPLTPSAPAPALVWLRIGVEGGKSFTALRAPFATVSAQPQPPGATVTSDGRLRTSRVCGGDPTLATTGEQRIGRRLTPGPNGAGVRVVNL